MTLPLIKSIKHQERLGATLALVAGYIDAYGFISYGAYLSFMSGNTTQTGYHIGQAEFKIALSTLIAIIFFVAGHISGNLIVYSLPSNARRLILSLVIFLQLSVIFLMQSPFFTQDLFIALLAFGMGIMNTALGHVGAQLLSLTFVTGTLSNMSCYIAMGIKGVKLPDSQGSWDTPWRRAALLGRIWSAFFTGALLAGIVTPKLGEWALILSCLALSVTVIYAKQKNKESSL